MAAGTWQVGAIYAKLGIDAKEFKAGLQMAKTTAKEFGQSATKQFDAIRAALAQVGRAAAGVGDALARGLNAVKSAFGKVFDFITSLKSLLVGFLAYKFVDMVSEADALNTAFRNLQRSMGELADVTLQKLRKATRGTVADMDLMRATNNAILLGVGKTADEWAELADAGRRLGKAVGRDALSSFNDLSYGIGRQSRLILDNLGLVVKVGEANEAYAAKIGKSVKELNLAEQRTAFYDAALVAIRKKMRDLGEDVPSLGEQFGILKAAVTNATVSIGNAILPALARIASALGNALAGSQDKLDAFSNWLRGMADVFIDIIDEIVARIKAGDLDIARAMTNIIAMVVDVMDAALGPFVTYFLNWINKVFNEVVGILIVKAGATVDKVFTTVELKIKQWTGLGATTEKGLQNRLSILDAVLTGGDTQTASNELAKSIGQAVSNAAKAGMERAGTVLDSEYRKNILDRINKLNAEYAKEASDITSPAESLFKSVRTTPPIFEELTDYAQIAAAKSAWDDLQSTLLQVKSVEEEWLRLRTTGDQPERLAEVDAMLKTLIEHATKLNKELYFMLEPKTKGLEPEEFSPLLLQMEEAVAGINSELRQTGLDKWTAKWAEINYQAQEIIDKVSKNEEQVAQIVKLRDEAHAALMKSADLERDAEAAKKFSEIIKQLTDATQQLDVEIKTAGASDFDKDVIKWESAIANFASQVENGHYAVRALYESLDEYKAKALEAAKSKAQVEEAKKFADGMRDLKKEIADLDIEMAGLGKTDAEQDILRFTAAFNELTASMDKASPAYKKAAEALAQYIDKRKQLGELKSNIEEWGDLGRDLSDSVLSGVVDGFARGEKASKTWANIAADLWRTSMSKAINDLSKLIGDQLGALFGQNGAFGGMAGVANGLIAIGGAIWSNIQAKKTSTVDDFSEAINSSEAIRGIVAGPTNVAIATVGDALKDALRVTEMLLERIARDIESGWAGTGGGAGGGTYNAIYPLTGSTT